MNEFEYKETINNGLAGLEIRSSNGATNYSIWGSKIELSDGSDIAEIMAHDAAPSDESAQR